MNIKTKYNTVIVFLFCFMLGHVSCIDDQGNYDYKDSSSIIPIEIVGIEDISITEHLLLTPQLNGMDDESKYEYTWYCISKTKDPSDPEPKKILAKSAKVDMPINTPVSEIQLPSGDYHLIFEIKNKDKDVSIFKQVTMSISPTPIGTGWYVLKSIDNETDFDYINYDGKMYADVLNNWVAPHKTQRLKGKPVKISYQKDRYNVQVTLPNGEKELILGAKAYHIVSSENIKVLNATTLKPVINNFEDNFYDAAGLAKLPQQHYIGLANRDGFLINDGHLYTIEGAGRNVSKYGYPKVKEDGDYYLDSSYAANGNNIMVFDKLSRSFLYSQAFGYTIDKFDAEPTTPTQGTKYVSLTNMDADLIKLSSATTISTVYDYQGMPGHAVMKNSNKEEYYLAWFNFKKKQYPFTAFDTIPANAEMPKASLITSSILGNFVYYIKGTDLKAYQNQTKDIEEDKKEILLKSLPADEKIAHIQEVTFYKDGKYQRRLMVLSNKTTGWKLYAFELLSSSNPEINPTPAFIYEGKGEGYSVMNR